MALEYLIYTDESATKGARYSHFYGGALVKSTDLQAVDESVRHRMQEQHLFGEVKWSKVTENYLDKYKATMDCFFDHVAAGRVKVRIMFIQNRSLPKLLTPYQREHQFFLLYYQFIKHAFGIRFAPISEERTRIRLYLDQLPDTQEKCALFRSHLANLSKWYAFRNAGFWLEEQQIAEVRSHDHPILQCLDVVLGAMQFKLNQKHLEKPQGSRVRGKKTLAKFALYKEIHSRIRAIYPNFNIGISTGRANGWADLWNHPYRHWSFCPSPKPSSLARDNLA